MNHVDIISIFLVLIGIAAVFVFSLFRSSVKADWKDMAIVIGYIVWEIVILIGRTPRCLHREGMPFSFLLNYICIFLTFDLNLIHEIDT
jgi:uncharacterized membrane protein SirB2